MKKDYLVLEKVVCDFEYTIKYFNSEIFQTAYQMFLVKRVREALTNILIDCDVFAEVLECVEKKELLQVPFLLECVEGWIIDNFKETSEETKTLWKSLYIVKRYGL